MKRAAAFITCGGGGAPSIPEALPKPTEQDPRIVASRDNERRRRAAAASNTVLTSYQGTSTQPMTQAKTLLGQ